MLFTRRFRLALFVLSLPAFAATAPGIKNFDQVDAHVYRGGQPTNEGFQYLSKLGVKTVIDLREGGSRAQAEALVVSADGMQYINVPMSGLTPPSDAEISKVLSILEDRTSGPVFVHCQRGADRTGTVIAAYHIDFDRWDNARALADANAHHMSVFQFPRKQYIKSFRPRKVEAKAPVAVPAPAAPAVIVQGSAQN